MSQTAEEFRDEQKQKARQQNQHAENAVPEQRPIASQVPSDSETEVNKKLRDAGLLNEEPMPKSAYDKADSKDQSKKAEKSEKKHVEGLRPGARVRVTKGPYEGTFGAITKVEYKDEKEAAKAASGDPAVARFAVVSEYQIRTRGGRHDLVFVEPDALEVVLTEDYARGPA